MQQDKERRPSFTNQPRFEERPRYQYPSTGPLHQDSRLAHTGNRPVESPYGPNYDSRGRRSPPPQQESPRRPSSSIQDRSGTNIGSGRFQNPPSTYPASDRARDIYSSREEPKPYSRMGDYFPSSTKERSPQRWATSATLPAEDYDHRPESRRRDRDDPHRPYSAYSPRSDRANPLTQTPPSAPSHVQYFQHGKPTAAVYQRPPSRDVAAYQPPPSREVAAYQPPQYLTAPADRTPYDNASRVDDRGMERLYSQGSRSSQLMSQFSLPTSAPNRRGHGYSYGEPSAPSSFRGPPSSRMPTDHEFSRGGPSEYGNETHIDPSRSPTNSFTQRSSHSATADSSPVKPLSLRDSIPTHKHQSEPKLSLKKQMEKFHADRLRLLEERSRDYQQPRPPPTRPADKGRNPLLSPRSPAAHIIPHRPGWSGGSYAKQQYRHRTPSGPKWKSANGEPRSNQKSVTEQRNDSTPGIPHLRIDTSVGSGGIENGSKPKPTAEQPRINDDTPPYPPASADERTESSSSPDTESPFPNSTWQGVSTSVRDGMVRRFASENVRLQAIVDSKNGLIQKENEVHKQSGELTMKATFLENYDNLALKISFQDLRPRFVSQFQEKEEELQKKIRSIKRQYRSLAKKWEQHCRILDEQMPPEEPVSVPIIELPLTGRVGRRNRGGPSDMVHSEFDLEQFAQKQVESDRVDAELLGRQNAAEIPDMIAVTRESWHECQYDDTNSLVVDPQRFYDYWPKDPWSDEEQDIFFSMLADVGKKFGVISSHPSLRHRSVQDCVRFYYRNKADVKYMDLANHAGKKKGHKRVGSAVGGLLGDIRAGEEKKTDKGGPEEEVEEDSDSAYEQEGQRRKTTKTRGRGRGRGRGGWRGGRGGALTRGTSPQTMDANGDIEMGGPRTFEGDAPANGWEQSLAASTTIRLTDVPNPRKRKARLDEGDDDGGPKASEKKKPISSYWLLADREKMRDLIEQHGDDYDTISAELTQKSGNQVRNYIRGKAELSEFLDQILVSRNLLT